VAFVSKIVLCKADTILCAPLHDKVKLDFHIRFEQIMKNHDVRLATVRHCGTNYSLAQHFRPFNKAPKDWKEYLQEKAAISIETEMVKKRDSSVVVAIGTAKNVARKRSRKGPVV